MNRRNFLKSILISICAFFGLTDQKKKIVQKKKEIPKEKIGWYVYDEPKIVIINDYAFSQFKDSKNENS